MLVIAIIIFTIPFNTFLAKKLPLIATLIFIIYIVGLFAVVIPLWVMRPQANAKAIFTKFSNDGGWNNAGTAFFIGLSVIIASMSGYDCSVHMCKQSYINL